MRKKPDNSKHVKLFQELIEVSTEPAHLRKVLTELYFDYSRMVIQRGVNGGEVYQEADDQLYWLSELIKIFDQQTKYPQYSNEGNEAA
ncbi:hypothetical protein [Pontibacter flavimaris]|uniref:Uncharacterized protein n=1 Tax=Pontibacter flavimaris TaxID=1797110 RepID=A0A1Q5PDF8_9BACT|nr:hypothetical protein [Pontibacter flavimaris]OKL40279.1 hypothetical protein A3841_18310 [Pontibacter flavimaris]